MGDGIPGRLHPVRRSRSRSAMAACLLLAGLLTAAAGRLAPEVSATSRTNVPVDWPTWGDSIARTGHNPSETLLGPGVVPTLTQKWTYTMDSVINSQAVEAAGVSTPSGSQDLVYVGDEHGNFVALNAESGALVWEDNLGSTTTTCTLTSPDEIIGITATAAIDRSTNRVYEVGGDGRLYAMDLGTGAVAPGWPVTVTTDTLRETDWGAITLSGTYAYVVIGGVCDKGLYHGRVAEIDTNAAKVVATFWVTPPKGQAKVGQAGGSIWGWGGSSLDPAAAALYVATGNSFMQPENTLYAESVIRLNLDTSLNAFDQPALTGTSTDLDFGTDPVLYQVPGCPTQLAVENKDGELMVYDRDSIGSGPVQRVQVVKPNGIDLIGQPAWSDTGSALYVYDPQAYTGFFKHGIIAFTESAPDCTLTKSWNTPFGNGGTASPPVVANGVVYEDDGAKDAVYALNATTGKVLWSSGSTISGPVYDAPTVVNGMVYVPSWDHSLHAFGLPS